MMTPWQIGWFIVAINLSDIAAKGGDPKGIVISLGLPKTYSITDLDEIIKGMKICGATYNCPIIGGDTKENPNVTLTGTAIGMVTSSEFMGRHGAQIDDVVAVTGTLGKAGAGYHSLQQPHPIKKIIKDLLEPIPRLSAGRKLASSKKVHCCMDLSDGLSSSLYQLGMLNKIGFIIETQCLPLSEALRGFSKNDSSFDPSHYALHFGGDYELLLTCSREDFCLLQQMLHQESLSLTSIGRVTRSKDIMLRTEIDTKPLLNKGYEHFTMTSSTV
jgi:thiamine-monophosphate kinase